MMFIVIMEMMFIVIMIMMFNRMSRLNITVIIMMMFTQIYDNDL